MAKFICTILLMLSIVFVIQNMAGVEGLNPGACASTCEMRCGPVAHKNDCLQYCDMCCQNCSCPFREEKFLNKASVEDLFNPTDCASTCAKRCEPVAYKKECLNYCNMCCHNCLCPFREELLNTGKNVSMLP